MSTEADNDVAGGPPSSTLTKRQYDELLKAVTVIGTEDGWRSVPGWHIKRTLTQIFGHVGWDTEVTYRELAHAEKTTATEDGPDGAGPTWTTGAPGWSVAYSIGLRLTVKAEAGNVLAVREGDATWESFHTSYAKALHGAKAGAATVALRLAASSIGDRLGASLYAGTEKPIVKWTLTAPGRTTEDTPTATDDDAGDLFAFDAPDIEAPRHAPRSASVPAVGGVDLGDMAARIARLREQAAATPVVNEDQAAADTAADELVGIL